MPSFGLRKKSRGDSAPKAGKRPKNKTRRPLVVCNECGFEFEMKIENESVKITEVKIGQCEVKYTACPKCDKVSVVEIVDRRLQKMDKNVTEVQDALRKLKSSGCKDWRKIKEAQDDVLVKNFLAAEREIWLMSTYKHRFRLRKGRHGKHLQFVPERQLENKGD